MGCMSQGATALHMAAHRGHAHALGCLARFKQCELNALDNKGRTALHHAAALGHVAVVTELWGRGCNLELADNMGWTGAPLAFTFPATESVRKHGFTQLQMTQHRHGTAREEVAVRWWTGSKDRGRCMACISCPTAAESLSLASCVFVEPIQLHQLSSGGEPV